MNFQRSHIENVKDLAISKGRVISSLEIWKKTSISECAESDADSPGQPGTDQQPQSLLVPCQKLSPTQIQPGSEIYIDLFAKFAFGRLRKIVSLLHFVIFKTNWIVTQIDFSLQHCISY